MKILGLEVQIALLTEKIENLSKHMKQSKKDKKSLNPDDHWNEKIHADYRAKSDLKIKEKELKSLKSIGITAAHIIPEKGIFKGQSDLILLDEEFTSLKPGVSQVLEFKSGGWSDRGYPNSLLGVIALIRQTFLDAEWYGRSMDDLN